MPGGKVFEQNFDEVRGQFRGIVVKKVTKADESGRQAIQAASPRLAFEVQVSGENVAHSL